MELKSADQLTVVTDIFTRQAELQDIMAGPGWRDKGFPFYRAIFREAAEVFDHLPWEWWKPGATLNDESRQQAMLELTDILCFGISDLLVLHKGAMMQHVAVGLSSALEGHPPYPAPFETARGLEALRVAVENLASKAVTNRRFYEGDLALCYARLGYGPEMAYLYYYGKNALNQFRQANGDKAGTYPRNWGGKPDNIHLAEIIETIGFVLTEADFMLMVTTNELIPHIYSRLQERYDLLSTP